MNDPRDETIARLREALDNLIMACELPGDHCEIEQAVRVARAVLTGGETKKET